MSTLRPQSDAQTSTDRALAYIEANYLSPISLRDVAGALGYSPAYLTHVFRKRTGRPITAWIIRKRIEAAQVFLTRDGVDVARACEFSGFTDVCYFTRQFVSHVGTTPGRYRDAQATTISSKKPKSHA